MGDTERLTMLYLLTIADSKATGPSAWSDWKASLLSELYLSIKACLGANCHVAGGEPEEDEQGVRWLRDQILAQLDGQPTRIDIHSLPADYLLSFSLEAVLQHLRVHTDKAARLKQQVLLFPEPGGRSWPLVDHGAGQGRLAGKILWCARSAQSDGPVGTDFHLAGRHGGRHSRGYPGVHAEF